jgi:hypothetical protein
MKRFFSPLVFGAILAPAALLAAPFEGTVKFQMTPSKGDPQEMVYSMKGDKVRIELPSQKGAMGGMIMDTTKHEMTVIMNQQRMYMTMPMQAAGADAAQQSQSGKPADNATLEKTGVTEKILGYTAEKYVSTSNGTKTEMWLAEGLGTFTPMAQPPGGPMGGRRGGGGGMPPQGWERALAGKELFPLRVVSHEKDGKESFKMEATAIDKTSLPDADFAPPAGFQKFDMQSMMRGAMPGGMGR